ncbi:MAG: hypothetical protein U1F76_00155 [Candidatus Competibacteraceae bacterium]
MTFFTEPAGYEKTILSDLQGAWGCLRDAVVEQSGFPGWDRMLFHIDEAMSWETVRHLERMEPLVVLIRNLAVQGQAAEEIMELLEDINDILLEIYEMQRRDKPL